MRLCRGLSAAMPHLATAVRFAAPIDRCFDVKLIGLEYQI
jgi:hypothetical protein